MNLLTWPLRLVAFVGWLIGRLVVTNLTVARDVVTRRQLSSPIIVGYRTICDSDLEVALLTMMISLTPGTLVLGIRDAPHAPGDHPRHGHSGSRIYVHVMYADRRNQALAELRRDEAKLLWALRPRGGPA